MTVDEALDALEITRVQVWERKPDEIVVLKVKGRVSRESAAYLRESFEERFPGQLAIVIDEAIDISVIAKP
jgi:hypothetical protein